MSTKKFSPFGSAVWPAIGNECFVLHILIENGSGYILCFIQEFSSSVLGEISNKIKKSAAFNSYCFVIVIAIKNSKNSDFSKMQFSVDNTYFRLSIILLSISIFSTIAKMLIWQFYKWLSFE